MTPLVVSPLLEELARAAHEVNRSYCRTLGDSSQVSWDEAPDWQRSSCIAGVIGALEGNSPAESHAGWLEHKRKEGWSYGPVKDEVKKTHPCFLPYEQLPPEQQAKDALFIDVVQAMAKATATRIWAKASP